MKKALLISALALAAFAPAKVHATWPIPIERPSEWIVIAPTEAVDNNGVGLENILCLGGKTGNLAHLIDDNPFTYWHSNWNQCNGTNDDHIHWFMVDRGEKAAEVSFTTIAFQQRVCQVTEANEETANWNGAVKNADVYLLDEHPGLLGGFSNMAADFTTVSQFQAEHPTPTLDVELETFVQNPQLFKFTDTEGNPVEHNERYILVIITHTISPNISSKPEDQYACLAGMNLYGEDVWAEEESFPAPYDNPWGDEALKKSTRDDRAVYALDISGGVEDARSPYLQKSCYRSFSHDDTCYDVTEMFTYQAFPGATITVSPKGKGDWMHNFLYVDWAGDGFETHENQADFLNEDGSVKEGSDLVSFGHSDASGSYKDSKGNAASDNGSTFEVRSFTIPTDLTPGLYRVRFKTDWNNLNPTIAVTYDNNNAMEKHGAMVCDFMLEILELPTTTLTLNFPAPYEGAEKIQYVVENVPFTIDKTVSQYIPADLEPFFTVGDYEDKIITDSDNTFDIPGTYNFDFSKVYRFKLKPQDSGERFMQIDLNEKKALLNNKTVTTDNADLFGPEVFWYLKIKEINAKGFGLTLHNVALGDEFGATTNGNNGNVVVMTENPTLLTASTTSNSHAIEGDFTLHVQGNPTAYFNDYSNSGYLAIYNAGASQNDNGSIIRVAVPAESEFTGAETFTYQGVKLPMDATKKEAAKSATIEAVCELFEVDEETLTIVGAEQTYMATTGVPYTEGEVNVPGYVSASEEAVVALRESLEAQDAAQIAEKVAALNEADLDYTYEPTPGAIFTLKNVESVRGHLCNTNGQATSTAGAQHREFDGSKDFQFTFVKVGDNTYLYNLGAEKFMNAFGAKTDHTDENMNKRTAYTWCFSNVPTAVREIIVYASSTPHSIAILGGVTSGTADGFTGTHEGGITMINGSERNLLVCVGVSNRGDGTGLFAEYVGKLSDDALSSLVSEVETTLAAVPEVPAEFDNIKGVVNHLAEEAHAELSTVVNGGGHDHVNYLVENGKRQGFDSEKVYNLFVGDQAYKFSEESNDFVLDEFNPEVAAFNFKVTKGSPVATASDIMFDGEDLYTFSHKVDGVDKALTINGDTQHALDLSEIGKVKIGDQAFVVKEGVGAAETTTEIREIGVSNGVDSMYDLQGRKLVAPVKGINIINGKKVLL